jgi:hypothetical protein
MLIGKATKGLQLLKKRKNSNNYIKKVIDPNYKDLSFEDL